MIAIIILSAIGFGLCSIVGALAKSRGRTFWGWTIIPFMLPAVFAMALAICLEGINLWLGVRGESAEVIPFVVVYTSPVVWFIALIAVLIAGKTKKRRLQEVVEEEQLRERVRSRRQMP